MGHFGLLTYSESTNLGDEIQSLAARRFLPKVDHLVSREQLSDDPGCDQSINLILNGWFLRNPNHWPPHHKIRPLLISFHVSQSKYQRLRWWRRTAASVLLAARNIEYLHRHGPVGARDRATLALLQQHGVKSYYSGCLTLTLARSREVASREHVVACDLDPEMLDELARRSRKPPLVISHTDTVTCESAERLVKAERLLQIYSGAKAVITSRLHCALPCLALETPVLFIPLRPDLYRQEPALELAHHALREDFLTRRDGFDPENPPENPTAHRPLADELRRRCELFCGQMPGM
jgi:hypothetical protein